MRGLLWEWERGWITINIQSVKCRINPLSPWVSSDYVTTSEGEEGRKEGRKKWLRGVDIYVFLVVGGPSKFKFKYS
jgi:hypothetical protein